LMYRIVAPSDELLRNITAAAGPLANVNKVLEIPPVMLHALDGFETVVVKFSTDIPCLTNWGQPFLIGPGSIHVAHTDHECISKVQIAQAVEIYVKMVKDLKNRKD